MWVTLGMLALGVGIIGIFVPGLPTVPFALVAAACFSRGSERLHKWLCNHKIFGPQIKDWEEHRGIRKKVKIFALTSLWIMISISIHMLMGKLPLQIFLVFVALTSTIIILRIKTIDANSEG